MNGNTASTSVLSKYAKFSGRTSRDSFLFWYFTLYALGVLTYLFSSFFVSPSWMPVVFLLVGVFLFCRV